MRILRTALRTGLIVGGIGVAIASWARYVEPRRIQLERVAIKVPAGAESLTGMKIGFLTDLHSGPFTSLDLIERGLKLITAESPDLLLAGGDFHSESPRYLPGIAALLGRYGRQAPLGCFGVMGNHDYAVSGEASFQAMTDAGVLMLRNTAVPITYGGMTLWIVGIDDTLLGEPDALTAFAQVPDSAAAIALWHAPVQAEQASALGAFLQLSGHTHGGQVRLPGVGPLAVPKHGKRHVIGLNSADGMPVYTSRGLGMYRPPVRLNCPPEVTLVTLIA
jgi:predicted MPP superfamily phosphohydrolase